MSSFIKISPSLAVNTAHIAEIYTSPCTGNPMRLGILMSNGHEHHLTSSVDHILQLIKEGRPGDPPGSAVQVAAPPKSDDQSDLDFEKQRGDEKWGNKRYKRGGELDRNETC